MKLTTRAKIILRKYFPSFVFQAVRKVHDRTIAKIAPSLFALRIRGFTEETIVPLSYFGHSFSLLINPKNGFLDKQIYAYKKYEVHILTEMKRQIQAGDTVLDIGANIGHHTLFMASLVGSEGRVVRLNQ